MNGAESGGGIERAGLCRSVRKTVKISGRGRRAPQDSVSARSRCWAKRV